MTSTDQSRCEPDPAISPRLFQNAALDRLSRVHPLVPVLVYVPVILALIGTGLAMLTPLAVAGAVAFGLVGWSLSEYLGHRYLFHVPLWLPGDWGPRLQFLIHGVHHDYPNDRYRLVMPPLLSLPIHLVALAVGRLLLGDALTWPALGGFILGYLCYDCIHYRLHHAVPRFRWERHLRMLHMRHHFHDSSKGFGVLSFWWDHVFGTAARGATGRSDGQTGDKSGFERL